MPPSTYGQPKYRAIAQRLREWIEEGRMSPGALVPTEKALMAEFRASRGTVRQAIALLREEGYLQTERARGTYVRHPQVAGEDGEVRHTVLADGELAALLGLAPGEPIVCRQTVVAAGKDVLAVVRRYSKS
ncbi:GntR family transcriptional regulator [Micromonospora chalcea]